MVSNAFRLGAYPARTHHPGRRHQKAHVSNAFRLGAYPALSNSKLSLLTPPLVSNAFRLGAYPAHYGGTTKRGICLESLQCLSAGCLSGTFPLHLPCGKRDGVSPMPFGWVPIRHP